MAINLQKGQRENLKGPKFTIGLGWDTNSSSSGHDFDLDASVFMLGDNKRLVSDEYFVFYNNLTSPDEALNHTGDNLTGEGDGDDESINVDLSIVNQLLANCAWWLPFMRQQRGGKTLDKSKTLSFELSMPTARKS